MKVSTRLVKDVGPLLGAALFFCMLLAPLAWAGEPLDLIPAESLLCWHAQPLVEPSDATAGGESASTLRSLLELGSRLAGSTGTGLDSRARLGLRMGEMLSLTVHYPHALAVIGAQAKATKTDPQARRVDRLRFVLVARVASAGQSAQERSAEPFLRIIQKTVNEQTNAGAATLVSKTAGKWRYQELSDHQLPDWALVAWGRIGEYFVLTVGRDVWPSIAAVAGGKSKSLSQDPWYAVARLKRGSNTLIEVFVAAEEIRRRLDDFVQGRASKFFDAWDAQNLEQAHWAIGFEGRAVYCVGHFRISGETVRRAYADPHCRAQRLLAMVPPETRYAICQIPAGRFLPQLFGGLVAVQGERARANIHRIWDELQIRSGINIERDILANLGEHIVLHEYPPHPLQLPLAITTLTEIHAHPEKVRATIDALCEGWQEALDEAAEAAPFTFQRDADGIWYLQFGLAGPAWVVTDQFIITSWSPRALRMYLAQVSAD